MKKFINKFSSKNFILSKETGKKINYEDLFLIIKKHLSFFKQKKYKKGEIVASFLPNSLENIVLFISCGLYGLKFFPIDCNTPEKKLEEILHSLKIKKLFIDKKNNLLRKKSYIYVNCNNEFEWLENIKLQKIKFNFSGKLILFTSGTTGNNKLIQIDFYKLINSAENFVKFYKINNENVLNIFQTSYLGGLFNSFLIPLMSSSNVVFFSFFSSLDILNFWKHVKNYNISTAWFTPSLIKSLLELKQSNYSNALNSKLNNAFCGTAYLNKKLKKKFNTTFKTHLLENYGLSETTFISLEKRKSKRTYENGFVGSLLDSVNLKLINADKKNIKEISVNTKYIFDGYIDFNKKLFSNIKNDYFATGDLGVLKKTKSDNFLYISGRNNEVIKKKGNLVNLNLIEELMQKNNLVKDAKAVSILDKEFLEDYKLFVQLKKNNNKKKSLQKLQDWIYLNLNRNFIPKDIIIKNKFPKTKSGKVKIFEL